MNISSPMFSLYLLTFWSGYHYLPCAGLNSYTTPAFATGTRLSVLSIWIFGDDVNDFE